MTVAYAEMQGFPIGKWKGGYFDGRRQLKVAWLEAAALLNALENTSWPYSDGPNSCTPSEATIRPFPGCQQRGSGSLASYEYALVDVLYTTRGPRWINNQKVTEEINPFAKALPVRPEGKLFWNDGTAVTNNVILRENGLQYDITFNDLTSMPSAVTDYCGYANSNTVTSLTLGRSFAPETLLYVGPKVTAVYSWGHLPRYNVKYSFHYWPYGHNKVFRPGVGYEYIYNGTSETKARVYLCPLTWMGF